MRNLCRAFSRMTGPSPENHPQSGLQNTESFRVVRDLIKKVETPPGEWEKNVCSTCNRQKMNIPNKRAPHIIYV